MATTPAQKRTPRRRASAPATDAPAPAAPASDTATTLSAAEAPAAKPARKAAAKTSAKAPVKAAAKTAVKPAARKAAQPAAKAAPAKVKPAQAVEVPAQVAAEAPAAPARKKAAKPAATQAVAPEAKPAVKAAAKTATRKAAAKAAEALIDPAQDAAAADTAPSTGKKVAARTSAAKTPAAKKAAAKKTVAKAPARKAAAPAAETMTAAEPALTEAPAAQATPDESAPQPTPARKRSSRKTAAAAAAKADEPAAEAIAEAATAAASDEPVAEPGGQTPAAPDSADSADAAPADTGDAAGAPDAPEAAAEDDHSDDGTSDASNADAETGGGSARSRNRRNRRRGRDRHRGERTERPVDAAAAATPEAGPGTDAGPHEAQAAAQAGTLTTAPQAEAEAAAAAVDVIAADLPTDAPLAPARPAAPTRPPRPAPSGPAHSTLRCVDGDQRQIVWHTGHGASDALFFAAQDRLGAEGRLADEDDDSLPRLLRQASDEGHRVEVDPAVWAQLAARRDARTRAGVLMTAYPDGPASAGLARLLAAPLPLFQAEGALWAVVAGRGLLADERGLGKSVQAIAAAQLWRRHFGVRRVAVISGAGERLAWQRAWRRFAGVEAQVMEGGLHQRQAFWSQAAEVRILAPEALASDAAHLAHWAPELVIVDEPQRLGLDATAWATLDQAPQALVLCGAALDDQPALLEQLVAWLDRDRLGAFAALREVQAAREGRATLDEAGVERVSDALSRSVLQRQRAEVADQLPAVVYSERIVPLAPAQREAHDRLVATLRRSLGGWLASGYLSDTEQWRLATTLRAALAACHRADPAVDHGPLADAVAQAVADQVQAWASDAGAAGSAPTLLLCETDADLAQLDAALAARGLRGDSLQLALAGQPVTLAAERVLQVGVPWRTRRAALLPAGIAADAVPGQQWQLLVAQDSLEAALFDTLASRNDVPRGAAEPGSRGFLQGERLLAWLQAVHGALQAMPAAAPSVGTAG